MLEIKSFTFNPFQENTYLLVDENNNTIIIDPGCYFDEEKNALADYIEKNALHPVQLLNTHAHLDHVFGNQWVWKKYGLEVYMHDLDRPTLERAPVSGAKYGIPFENYSGPLHFLKEGDIIHLGQNELKVIFVPGHAPGHIAFYDARQHFVIGGDVLFRQGIGRTDLPGSNTDDLLDSIRTKLFTLPDDTAVYPGHGPTTTIGYEKENNPFVHHQ